jgi:hypothetical protein
MQKYANRSQHRNVIRANVCLWISVKIVSGVERSAIPDTCQNPHLPKSFDMKEISTLKTDEGYPIFFIAETF